MNRRTLRVAVLVCALVVGTIALPLGTAGFVGTDGVAATATDRPSIGEHSKPTSEFQTGDRSAIATASAQDDSDDDRRIRTTHLEIYYAEGYGDEAERIAEVGDDHYEHLLRVLSVRPPENRVPVIVGPEDESPCEAVACVDPLGRVHLPRADRSLLHHELVHTIQLREHWSPLEQLSEPDPAEGALIEGTAKYLDSPAEDIADRARFDPDAIELTSYPTSSTEYAERALFVEYVLATYGRDAFDVLYLEGSAEALEEETGEEYETVRENFLAELPTQRDRLRDGGAPLPAFSYDAVTVAPGESVTFDARTPEVVAALDREWYPDDPDGFAWDVAGDGEVDATGATATRTFDRAGAHEVTVIATIDGEEYAGTQTVFVVDPVSIEADLPSTADAELAAAATVTNEGDAAATRTVTYRVDGAVVDAALVSLDPGASETIDLSGEVPDSLPNGTYDQSVTIAVDEESAERTDADGTDGTPDDAAVDGTVTIERSNAGGDSDAADDAHADDAESGENDAESDGESDTESDAKSDAESDDESDGEPPEDSNAGSANASSDEQEPTPGFGPAIALAALALAFACLRVRGGGG